MPSTKLLSKLIATAAIIMLAYGPLGAVIGTPVAQAAAGGPCQFTSTNLGNPITQNGTYNQNGQCVVNGAAVSTGSGGIATDGNGIKTPTTQPSCSGLWTCVAYVIYLPTVGLTSYIASWAAEFFSYTASLTLQSTAYALGFLTTSWTTVLSLANMFFIFILVYLAFVIMLKAETSRSMQTLAWVIAIALIVNFSFFLTRTVIDAGNILAIQFYNQIITLPQVAGHTVQGGTAAGTPTDLTAPIMAAVGIDQLLSKGFPSGTAVSDFSTLITYLVVFIAMAVMFMILAWGFFMVGIKFLLRVVGLWLVIIASPVAFVAQTLHETRKYFSQWLHALISLAFYPAVFLLMYYMLILMTSNIASLAGASTSLNSGNTLGNGILQNISNSNPNSLVTMIVQNSIAMAFIIALLYLMLKVSDWFMAQVGGSAVSMVSRISTSGALPFIGRQTKTMGARTAGGLYTHTVGGVSHDLNNTLKGTRFGNTGFGSFLRRNTVEPLSKTTFGGAKRYPDILKVRDEHRKERESNLENIQARKEVRRLGEIEKTWEKDEKMLQTLRNNEKNGITLDPPAKENLKRLEGLETERAVLVKHTENMDKGTVTSLKAADIEAIIKHISDKQVEAIKESGKFTAEAFGKMKREWNEQSRKAPMGESKKQIGELIKLQDTMNKKGILKTDELKSMLPEFAKNITSERDKDIKIDLRTAEAVKKEVESIKDDKELVRQTSNDKAEKQAAGKQATELKKAIGHLDKLIDKIKDVPEEIGGEKGPAAFKYRVVSDVKSEPKVI